MRDQRHDNHDHHAFQVDTVTNDGVDAPEGFTGVYRERVNLDSLDRVGFF